VRIGVLVCACVLSAATAGAQAPSAAGRSTPPPPRPGPEWPGPPASARIRFLRAIDPAAVRGKPSLLSRIVKVITGGRDEPQMVQPYGIAVGSDRRIYVADTFGRAVHVYDLEKPGYSTIKVDGDSLIGIGFSKGLLFVTDSASGRLMCLDAKGHTLWTRGPKDGFERPTGLTVGRDRLYVVDTLQHRVAMVSLTGAILGSFGEHGNGPGQLNFPTNVAQGGDGRVYVTDTMNFRVQVFDRDGLYLRTFGQLGDGSGDFDKPKGIAVDSAGHVYVVEGLHDIVQIFDEAGGLLLAFGESGSGAGQFWLPTGIAIVNDVVYVSDSANRRIELFEYVKEVQ
jgi:DNA-binding beta-propeller fold protein YncE